MNIYFKRYYRLTTLRIAIYQTTARSILVYHFTTISLQNLSFYYRKYQFYPWKKITPIWVSNIIFIGIGIIFSYFIFWIYNIVILLCVIFFFFNPKKIIQRAKLVLYISQLIDQLTVLTKFSKMIGFVKI